MALRAEIGLMGVLTALLSRTIAAEFGAWSPSIVRGLIKFAVARLPEGQRERLEEEWNSHINEVPGQTWKFREAIGFVIAACKIALTERNTRVLDELKRAVTTLGESHFMAAAVADVIQNNRFLISNEGIRFGVNHLRSTLATAEEGRRRVANEISAAFPSPTTFADNLRFRVRCRVEKKTIDRITNQLIRNANEMTDASNGLLKQIKLKTGEKS